MRRRIAGVVVNPRATLAGLIRSPKWLDTWSVILLVWAICGTWLLSTAVGEQALVDERVRVIETFGGTVTDAEYAALQATPPRWVYLSSGGRLLLTPVTTLLAALVMWAVTRLDGGGTTPAQALAVVVHATVVLAIGQVVATPLHYVRESLTSPLNLAAVLPLVEDGTLAARFFGTLDLFAVWWAGLLALGASVLTGRPVGRYAWPLAALFVAFAAVAAAAIVLSGGA